jgi:hypothetical protein
MEKIFVCNNSNEINTYFCTHRPTSVLHNLHTECHSLVVSIPTSHSGGTGFISRRGDRVSWGFRDFSQSLQQCQFYHWF